jgi:hypothetical protein
MTDLGSLYANWFGQAEDLTQDGTTIVGFDVLGLARKAWVWKAEDGLRSLENRLLTLGVGDVPALQVCRAVSEDGNVVVGGGLPEGGGPFDSIGFIAEFDSDWPQWTDLGNGLAGTNGVPTLDGNGPLTANSATGIVLSGGMGGAPAAFVIGLDTLYAPFKQGVLVPLPDLFVFVPALAPSGSVGWTFHWPTGLPAGFSTYWQCLVVDAVAPAGVAISNALQGTTP